MPRSLALALTLLLLASSANGQPPEEKPAAQPQANDSTEAEPIRAALRSYAAAFNANDPAALAAFWAPQGVYANKSTGERTVGREALKQDFEALFEASPGARLAGDVESVRLIRPDVAAAEGSATVSLPDGEVTQTSFSAIYVKEGDAWLLDSLNESELPSPETSYDALVELEWLVGHWVDQTVEARVDTTVRWSPNEAFLLRSFSVLSEDEEPTQGTQVIGWDPIRKQIRSWTFNSDGSFGEGTWSRNDADWQIKTTQTLTDGRIASATQVITRVDDDTLTVQTLGRMIDGEPTPATDPVTVRRVEEPQAASEEPAAADAPAANTPAEPPAKESAPKQEGAKP